MNEYSVGFVGSRLRAAPQTGDIIRLLDPATGEQRSISGIEAAARGISLLRLGGMPETLWCAAAPTR